VQYRVGKGGFGTREKGLLRDFVRENFATLMSIEDRQEEIKTKKLEFFRDLHKREAGMPKNTEIARELCSYLVDVKKVENLAALQKMVEAVPFLRRNVYERNHAELGTLFEQREVHSVLTSEELKDMHREEFLAKKEKEIVDRAQEKMVIKAREITQQMHAEVEARYKSMSDQIERSKEALAVERQALERVKSEIEAYETTPIEDIPYFPAERASTSEAEPGLVWWERLGLFGDPFPTVDGLSEIDENYYDSLVLKTAIFQKYLRLTTMSPNELLNKTYLITGEFGSGKTTLFDYLKKPMFANDLLPLHVIIDAKPDTDTILRSFYRNLFGEIAEHYKRLAGWDPRSSYEEIGKEELFDMLKQIVDDKKLKGVIIMLDGLHKDPKLLREALSFIQILQNTKDYWVRKGIGVGILIAGTRDWERELDFNPAIRGSINRVDTIPGITAKEAYDMISMRLATFSRSHEKPVRVRASAVDGVFKVLSSRHPRGVAFRDVIDDVLPHLQQTDIGYVEIAISFDKELLDRLRKGLEEYRDLKDRIELLRRRPDAFLPAIQILSILLEKKRIPEKDDLFRSNSGLFAMLKRVGLVQKARAPDTGEVSWIPVRLILEFGRKIELAEGLKPSEFLMDLFRQEQPTISPLRSEPDEVLRLRSLISAYRASHSVLAAGLEAALETHRELIAHANSPVDLIPAGELISRTSASMESILKCLYLVIEPETEPPFCGRSAQDWLEASWVRPPEILVFWDEAKRVEGRSPDKNEAGEITRSYLRAFRSITAVVEQMIRCNSIANISSPDLRKGDKISLNEARMCFQGQSFFASCRKLTDYMESRIRAFLYDVLVLKYGDKWRARLGSDVNQYIDKERKRATSVLPAASTSSNELYLCGRQHYRIIITEVPSNWAQIFSHCFEPENEDFVNQTLHLLFTFGDKDKHNQDEEYFRQNSDKLLLALQSSVRLLGRMNKAYVKVLSPTNVFIESDGSAGDRLFFSFLDSKDETNLIPFLITRKTGIEIVGKLVKRLKGSGFILDLADREGVEYAFGKRYRDTVAVLAYLVKKGGVSFSDCGGSCVSLKSLAKGTQR
jgi:hypothetical protein